MNKNNILFSEKQYFRQPFIWAILLGLNGFSIFGFVRQVILGHQFGDKPVSDSGLILSTILLLGVTVLFFSLRLETIITNEGIYVRFFPFQLKFKEYSWSSLTKVFVRQYNPITEYGGWGLRGIGKNKALNVSGNKGIQLITRDGSKMLIGTNKPEEASNLLRRMGHQTTA